MSILDELRGQGFTFRPLPIDENLFLDTAALTKEVIVLFGEELRLLQICQTTDPNETPLGFTRKEGRWIRNEWHDPKWYVHVDCGGVFAKASHIADWARGHPTSKMFLKCITALCEAYHAAALPILDEFERVLPGMRRDFVRNSIIANLQVRVNAYDVRTHDEIIAAKHCDKSLVTLDGWASGPGLFLVPGDEEIPAPHQPGMGLVMPGLLLSRMTRGAISPLPHLVRQPPGQTLGDQTGRMSIVCFADWLPGTGAISSYSDTHPEQLVAVAQ